MYQKVRFRLTLLFSGVTGLLLLIFLITAGMLSFRSQLSISLANFTRQSVSAADEVNAQNVITTDWLSEKETAGSFYLFLVDQGTPVFHNSTQPDKMQNLFHEILPFFSPNAESFSLPSTFTRESEEHDIYLHRNGLLPEYFLYAKRLPKNNSILQFFTIQPLDELYASLTTTAASYLLLLLAAGFILILFSWHFTGRLLRPLEDARQSQNRFISYASHELRTPLAVILANASACRAAPISDQRGYFDIIEREGEQMSALLEQLLTLSRADSHALTMQMEETDLQTLLLEVYEAFYPLAQKEKHHLIVQLPEDDIPVCRCDAFRLEQLLSILIRNALSYTPEDCRIFISLACQSHYIEISVADNGPGIPDSEKERIFERFYRCDKNHSQKGHHGLGLSVAREIALAHQGTLTVKDSEMGGAEFVLRLLI